MAKSSWGLSRGCGCGCVCPNVLWIPWIFPEAALHWFREHLLGASTCSGRLSCEALQIPESVHYPFMFLESLESLFLLTSNIFFTAAAPFKGKHGFSCARNLSFCHTLFQLSLQTQLDSTIYCWCFKTAILYLFLCIHCPYYICAQ